MGAMNFVCMMCFATTSRGCPCFSYMANRKQGSMTAIITTDARPVVTLLITPAIVPPKSFITAKIRSGRLTTVSRMVSTVPRWLDLNFSTWLPALWNAPNAPSMNAPIVEIGEDDFGIWYMDCQDEPQKYVGKTVRFLAQVCQTNRAGKNSFVPGRFAMTCCVQDIQFVGFPCSYGALKYGRFNPMLEIVDLFEDYTDDGTGKSAKIVTRTDGNEDAYIANFHNMNNASVVNTLMSVPFVKYNDLYEPFANFKFSLAERFS